jgi:hypothetical protein
VELGYNNLLQKKDAKANTYFDQALERIKKKSKRSVRNSKFFERKVLLEYALKSYQLASGSDEDFNFITKLVLLYGQMANMEMMIATFEDAYTNPQNSIRIQNQLVRFMVDEGMQISMNSCERH